ncbi:hypothetical protein IFM89_014859 [Coptis chinensis]|uniref:Ubiquitinyl hydrolase 1 n=1 Tax=Coptis chinensis TaxID=261450 RepID=A0A835IC11_9MAGN|nr:hypothetical protein IFM89_014859 [Coptis chinensis]
MNNNDVYRVVSMSRSENGSNRFWRNTGEDVFSRSSREENDEEALRWAALERLPTFDRIQKGILNGLDGQLNEVDIKHIGNREKKSLLDRLVRNIEVDNEKFLQKLKERMDRVDIQNPTIEVRFENINISAEAYIGDRALPTVFNASINAVEGLLNTLHVLPSQKTKLSILENVSGIIKPGRMTLLLGPPGSGKTTLLLALAGKLDSDLKVSGKITYNGHEMDEFVPQEEFCLYPDIDVFMKAASLEGQKENVITEYFLKILGLDICADTMVGNVMIRGISGGQKKRVTTGEMLVGPAKAFFMDEISTGLDSSTTFQIVNSLRQSVHILGGTAMIALLQPAPETYDLFDDIVLLSEGHIVYQGPHENVLEFFELLGFKCPERKGVADFLQEVTSRKDQQQYWACKDEPYHYVSVKEFAEAFQSFHVGHKLGDELSTPFDKRKSHPAALTTSKYGISKKEMFKACLEREWLLMKRNSIVHISQMVQLVVVAFIATTLFLRTKLKHNTVDDGIVLMGAMFFATVTILFSGFAELAMTIEKLPVFYKQRDLLFYPSWAYALPTWLLKIPISFSGVFLWVTVTYYGIGYDSNIQRFFRHYLLLVLIDQMASGLFRVVGGVSRKMVIANTFGSFVLLVVLTLGGFIISRVDVPKFWIWGYWISPLTYAQNALAVNEFFGGSWSHILPNSTQTLGIKILESRGVFTNPNWYWIGAGALIAYIVLFNIIFILSLTYLNFGKTQAVLSKEALKEKRANRTGELDDAELLSEERRFSTQSDTSGKTSGSHTEILRSAARSGSAITEASGESSQSKKGMVLPFTPYSITFDNIKYSVDMPEEMKVQGIEEDRLLLLKDISGAFRPGVLTALMGVSGAGKTTLMDVLAGRKTGGYVEGSITISGYPKKQETFARISGYCEQTDIHSPNVTVYESLLYSAWLRLPTDVDSAARKMFIEEVMELVELNSLRRTLVGLPGVSGLSTEQRKRLTIAVELVANPSIIFMDEPTSGLDARAAAIVMRTVRNTVNTGRTVVCTIHQPSIDIFEAFDELFLMKRGGEEIYVGPLGHNSCHLIKYFEGIKGVPKIRDKYNPATWMLEVTTAAQEENLEIRFAEIYKGSDLFQRNKVLIKELSVPPPGSKDLYFSTQYSQPIRTQCMACLWKQHLSYWRDPAYTAVRIFFTIVVALMFGSIFWKQGSQTFRKQELFNAMGSIFTAVLFIGTQNASAVQPVVAVERTVFYRERAAGMYSAFPYAFAQVAIEIPHIFLQTLIYGVIVYAMIDFKWTVAKFLWYLFYMYFTFLYFTYYGMMAVGLTPNGAIAAIASSSFYSIWSLFAGFVIARPQIPVWWRWYYWGCPISWTLYGLGASQYGDIDTKMETGESVKDFLESHFGYKYESLGWISAGPLQAQNKEKPGPTTPVSVKWQKEVFQAVEIDTDQPPLVFKCQLYDLTGVPPERQKIMVKGGLLKDDADWAKLGVKEGQKLMMMGTADEIVKAPEKGPVFMEDLPEEEQVVAVGHTAGMFNLGNTCYMNSTVQCLHSVPELKSALIEYPGRSNELDQTSHLLTVATRDLFSELDKNVKPVAPMQFWMVLRKKYPQFGQMHNGGYMQQDAEECWTQLMYTLSQSLKAPGSSKTAFYYVSNFFGDKFTCRENVEPLKELFGVDLVSRYLTVQFVRFFWKRESNQKAKILRKVDYPLELDVYDLCSDELRKKLEVPRKILRDEEGKKLGLKPSDKNSGAKDNDVKMIDAEGSSNGSGETSNATSQEGIPAKKEQLTGIYDLVSVLTHKGRSADSGHYVAWVKQENGKWIQFDDNNPIPQREEDITKLSGGGDWHMAYICMYKARVVSG